MTTRIQTNTMTLTMVSHRGYFVTFIKIKEIVKVDATQGLLKGEDEFSRLYHDKQTQKEQNFIDEDKTPPTKQEG